jgi:hypothetical protein
VPTSGIGGIKCFFRFSGKKLDFFRKKFGNQSDFLGVNPIFRKKNYLRKNQIFFEIFSHKKFEEKSNFLGKNQTFVYTINFISSVFRFGYALDHCTTADPLYQVIKSILLGVLNSTLFVFIQQILSGTFFNFYE